MKEKKAFKDLLRIDTIRGKHSVGIAYSEQHTGNINVYKETWGVDDFLQKKEVEDQFLAVTNCIIGHNRHATVGKINKSNAHPFQFENITGVHNGTLRQRFNLDDYKDFDVDSENLYHHMNSNSLQHTVDNMTGAWSLAWLDHTEGTLNLYRNSERPMSYCFSKDGKTLFFASEPYMLHLALSRNGVDYDTIYLTSEDTLNTFELPEKVSDVIEHLPRTVVKKTPTVKKQLPAVKNNTPSGTSQYETYPANLVDKRIAFEVVRAVGTEHYVKAQTCFNGDENPIEVRLFCSNKTHKELYNKLATSINLFTGIVKRYSWHEKYLLIDLRTVEERETYSGTPAQEDENGNVITQEELDRKYGECAWCSSPLVVGEAKCYNDGVALCSDCQLDGEVQEFLGEL